MAQASPIQRTIPAVSLKKLNLTNFRNYVSASVDVEPGNIVITGNNGSGKTNLLEAVSLLAPGRGIRGASVDSFASQKPKSDDNPFAQTLWSVNATINSGDEEVVIGTGVQAENEKRIVKINGEKQRGHASLSEYFAVCYLTPRMDSLFVEGSTSRRQYLDRLTSLIMPDHTKHLSIYEHAKSERMKLLKDHHADEQWLEVLEQRMAEKGTAIAASRLEVINLLQGAINEDSSPFPKAELNVAGEIEESLKTGQSAVIAENILSEILKSQRAVDRSANKTTKGPHKSDFIVSHGDNGFQADLCSTGEQKALLLSITIASVRAKALWSNMVPVLLLDEVVAHLDDGKREALANSVEELGTQCWMTGTEKLFFSGFKEVQNFAVKDGVVSKD